MKGGQEVKRQTFTTSYIPAAQVTCNAAPGKAVRCKTFGSEEACVGHDGFARTHKQAAGRLGVASSPLRYQISQEVVEPE